MRFVNLSDLAGPEWRFLEPQSRAAGDGLEWSGHSGRPRNLIEQRIRRPALSRWRGAFAAVRELRATAGSVLVSHLPPATLAANMLRDRLCPERPHLAFAFNYTNLPQGRRLQLARKGLHSVDTFLVFSRFERALYAEMLGLPIERFVFLPWAAERPEPDANAALPFEGPYLCAIGGEGRDYATLIAAARLVPQIPLAIVARPHNLAGLSLPDHVRVFRNLPKGQTWALAAGARGMVIPLNSATTPNGHVTMIGAQKLGVPLAVTRSAGVADYVDETTAVMTEPADPASVAQAMTRLFDDPAGAGTLAKAGQAQAEAQCDARVWLAWFQDYARQHGG